MHLSRKQSSKFPYLSLFLLICSAILLGVCLYLWITFPTSGSKEQSSAGETSVLPESQLSSSPSDHFDSSQPEESSAPESSIASSEEAVQLLDPDRPMIALTFDDGTSPYTKTVVDLLLEHHCRATFFIVGKQAEKQSDSLLYLSENGMEIGSHTYSHNYLTTLDSDAFRQEIDGNNHLIEEITGTPPKLLRPPYGDIDEAVLEQLAMPAILWNVDPADWKILDAEKVAAHVLDHVQDGSIILLHESYPSTIEAVKIILPKLLEEGYQITTVSDLFASHGEELEAHQKYRYLSHSGTY